MKNYYNILGLRFGASLAEVKSAYRKLAFQYHPDKTEGNKTAQEKFIEITEAYSVLSNTDKSLFYHIEYDKFLHPEKYPQTAASVGKYNDFRQYQRAANGPASKRTMDLNAFNIGAITLFLLFILYMAFTSFKQIKEREKLKLNNIVYSFADSIPARHSITKDEYYMMISEEFLQSNDSALMKIENVDSMMKVIDSINHQNQ